MKKITAIYFSPAGNAKKIAEHIASSMGETLGVPTDHFDFTLPAAREEEKTFSEDEAVVFVMPVYAGRLPNKLLSTVQNNFKGSGTKAVIACSYGNRSFGDGLTELRDELTKNGFTVIAAAAVPSEHSFDSRLAAGRPNDEDLSALSDFAKKAAEKAAAPSGDTLLFVPGNSPVGPYYTPLGRDGKPAVFLKAKPKTDVSRCDSCGKCAEVCPMGSISRNDFTAVTGICIKCHACIRSCPTGAKYLDDAAFLSHKEMLVENFTARKEIELFL